jgi:hypothetical protein
MGVKQLPAGPVPLFNLAEETANALTEQQKGLQTDEALLRASIVWAQHARDCYLAAVERAKTSSKARAFVEPARWRAIRAHWHLRQRLAEVIARKAEVN